MKSITPAEHHCPVVLGVHQKRERGCRTLNGPMNGVHQHQLAKAPPLEALIYIQSPNPDCWQPTE